MFRQATIRLTLLFTAVLLVVFGVVAVGVYLFVVASFDYDNAASDAVDAAEQSFADLRDGLLLGYLAAAIVLPVICLVMVRLVLRPVRRGFEAQERFVDDASHEFRTPLSIVQGELELAISRPRTEDEYVQAITTALDEVDQLNSLTADLLLLTRGSTIELSGTFRPVDLRAVVERAVGSSSHSGDGSRVTLSTIDSAAFGSETLLVRAIANVVDNAVKFSPGESVVLVTMQAQSDRTRVIVSDSGPGLTAEEQAHVFDRFWRGETSRTLPGRGLGLALVKQIMQAHRGTVVLRDNPGGGTRVVIELPSTENGARK
ncbi:sensor histidine kinase [Subtercola boreus]|uniref:histidine kinase n=1 Tax=Subtercola boreus TaxID=120213 RepID=A0A3E0W6M1_9MICO|nr:HAMP domain-containing sensor histidine kinase [Subtercola boreus]RFA18086.1 hypothetical protein B7R24_15670 [Subtercola boreus]RFA18468.1 hypothetical protein B7R23_15705 [Subtercola boreus]RFA24996.1 hypothetical protein B7R25_15700 [Subtercola boreus]